VFSIFLSQAHKTADLFVTQAVRYTVALLKFSWKSENENAAWTGTAIYFL